MSADAVVSNASNAAGGRRGSCHYCFSPVATTAYQCHQIEEIVPFARHIRRCVSRPGWNNRLHQRLGRFRGCWRGGTQILLVRWLPLPWCHFCLCCYSFISPLFSFYAQFSKSQSIASCPCFLRQRMPLLYEQLVHQRCAGSLLCIRNSGLYSCLCKRAASPTEAGPTVDEHCPERVHHWIGEFC